jgi:hypothetical protein
LRVSVVAVICFRGEPTIDVIAVSNFQTSGIGRSPRDSVAATVLGKEARPLHAYFIPNFLRQCSNRKKQYGCDGYKQTPFHKSRFPIFKEIELPSKLLHKANNNALKARFYAIGVLTVCLERERERALKVPNCYNRVEPQGYSFPRHV